LPSNGNNQFGNELTIFESNLEYSVERSRPFIHALKTITGFEGQWISGQLLF
jgi:hypothetical protein